MTDIPEPGNVIYLPKREPPELEAKAMVETCVYDDGRVTVWLGDEVITTEQYNWALAAIASAAGLLASSKPKDTPQ